VLATTSATGRGNPNATSIYAPGTADVSLGASGTTVPSVTTGATAMTSPTGGSAPHENMQPFGTLQCIIALQGIFPSRQ
jgi:microcystin-dependent protein